MYLDILYHRVRDDVDSVIIVSLYLFNVRIVTTITLPGMNESIMYSVLCERRLAIFFRRLLSEGDKQRDQAKLRRHLANTQTNRDLE